MGAERQASKPIRTGRLRLLCWSNYLAALLFSGGLVWMMATGPRGAAAAASDQPAPSQEASNASAPQRSAAPVDAGVGGAGGSTPAGEPRTSTTPKAVTPKAAAPQPLHDRWQLPLVMILAGGLGAALCNLRGIFMYSSGELRARGQKPQDEPEFPQLLETPYYVRLAIGPCVGLASLLVASLAFAPFSENSASAPSWDNLSLAYRYMGLAFLSGFASKEFMQALKNTAEGLFGQKPAAKDDTKPGTGEDGSPGAGASTPPPPGAPRV
jgi:hypothetical protein